MTNELAKSNKLIYRIWYNERWYYDLNAILSILEISNDKAVKEMLEPVHFIIEPIGNTSEEKLETIISVDSEQIIQLLQIVVPEEVSDNQPISKKTICELFNDIKIGYSARAVEHERLEKEGFSSLMGKTKEDYYNFIEEIFDRFPRHAFSGYFSFVPVGRQFNVYKKMRRIKRLISQPRSKSFSNNLNWGNL